MESRSNPTPSFKELYANWQQNGRASLINSPFLPICKHCRRNIFDELEHLQYEVEELKHYHIAPNWAYYRAYLIEKNDYDELVCYAHYQEHCSKIYEPRKRLEILTNDTTHKKYEQLNIPKRFWGRNFYNRETIDQQLQMNTVAQDFIKDGYKGSLLFSSVQRGFGKTDLVCSILMQYWIDNGGSTSGTFWKDEWGCLNSDILFLNETDLYFMIRSTYAPNARYQEYEIYKQLSQRVKLLAIDDMFFIGDKSFMRGVLSRLIHKRVDEEMLPIILTSNCTLPMLTNIDRSLGSRLSRGRYVSVDPKQKSTDLRTIYQAGAR